MRTTLALEPDVALRLKRRIRKRRISLKQAVREAWRSLPAPPGRPRLVGTNLQCPAQRRHALGNPLRPTDAHLAALAIEYQAELASTDADFVRFPGLRWFNPVAVT